jgi:hypothetical protein
VLVVTSNKLKINFAGLVTSGIGPDVAGGPPVALILFLRFHLGRIETGVIFTWQAYHVLLFLFLKF